MASYRLTKKATEDLTHIWNYTVDTWSENQAGKHIIFYRMINRDVVEIARILHERMDLKRIRE